GSPHSTPNTPYREEGLLSSWELQSFAQRSVDGEVVQGEATRIAAPQVPAGSAAASPPTPTTTSPRSANLTPLATRFKSTWRGRPASPLRASGDAGLRLADEVQPLAVGPRGRRAQGVADRSEKSPRSSSGLKPGHDTAPARPVARGAGRA